MSFPGRHRGFTLIEILVALTVIAIVVSVALLSINVVRTDREVVTEGERLVELVRFAHDDAILQGREYGLEVLRDGYRFVEFDPVTAQWAEIPEDETLKTWTVPAGIELSLWLEGKAIVLAEEPADIRYDTSPGATPNRFAPQLLIFSSGEVTPFEMRITRLSDRAGVTVKGDLLGNLELIADAQDNPA